MYEQFFGFRERPFELTPNPRFLVMTDAHREALSNLEYAISGRKGITLLLGEAGCGKTTIVRTAIDRQPSRVHCVHVTNPALTRNEFVETLATQFELTEGARRSKATLLSELEGLLTRRRAADETTVLIVDEAQSLSNELLEEIRLLANIEVAEEKLISLVLAGQPELSAQLNQESLRQLKQRVALRCELRPLTEGETLAYLAGRVRAAGGVASRVFTREAATLLHQYSGGIPRLVNVLADNSLLAAFGKGSTPVTSQIVSDVAVDFQLVRDSKVSRDIADVAVNQALATPIVATEPPASGISSLQSEVPVAMSPVVVSMAAEPDDAARERTGTDGGDTPRDRPLFGVFTTKRRFPFLGSRGTA